MVTRSSLNFGKVMEWNGMGRWTDADTRDNAKLATTMISVCKGGRLLLVG